jgi:outer membrane protein TolC
LARDAVKDRCRDDYNTSVNSARVGNEIAFNRYVTGLGTGGDVPTLQAALDAAGQTLIAAQQAASAASAAGYTPEHCP